MSYEFTVDLSPEQLERLQNAKNQSFDFLLDIGDHAGFVIRGASLMLETNVTTHEIPIDIGPGHAYDDDFEPEEEPDSYTYDEIAEPIWHEWFDHPRFYFPYIVFYLLCFWLVNVLIVRCIFKAWNGMELRRAFFMTLELIFNGILIFFFSVTIITAIHDVLQNMFMYYYYLEDY